MRAFTFGATAAVMATAPATSERRIHDGKAQSVLLTDDVERDREPELDMGELKRR